MGWQRPMNEWVLRTECERSPPTWGERSKAVDTLG